MSEMPERKVLKDILVKLKAKAITSMKNYLELAKSTQEIFAFNLKEAREYSNERAGDQAAFGIFTMSSILDSQVHSLIRYSISLLDDMQLYMESLEKYSGELDKTLWDAIEQAKKKAEEQMKEQEEIMKRKSPESYIK